MADAKKEAPKLIERWLANRRQGDAPRWLLVESECYSFRAVLGVGDDVRFRIGNTCDSVAGAIADLEADLAYDVRQAQDPHG